MNRPEISRVEFGTYQGQPVGLFELVADTELGRVELGIAEWGATLQRCVIPDASGKPTDIVLGYDSLADYVAGDCYFGAIAGRYGNRLRDGKLILGGNQFDLPVNEGTNQLHGGPIGFDKKIWQGTVTPEGDGVALRLVSPDGDMGFPGELTISVTYRVTPSGGLNVEFTAWTDKPTVCNPVQHALWNLGGHASGSVRDQVAGFDAAFYTPVDENLLATGEILSVTNTPFDFRAAKPIGRDLDSVAGGYDHNFILGLPDTEGVRDCADIVCPSNGIGLKLRTNEPGLQFYTGGNLSPDVIGKEGKPYCQYGGFTLETQKFPCSPEFSHFPSAELHPKQTYNQQMLFTFYHQ